MESCFSPLEDVHLPNAAADDGWTFVKNKMEESGIVPTAYLAFEMKSNTTLSSSMPNITDEPLKSEACVAMYRFEKNNDDEISVVAGETLNVIKQGRYI